MLAPWKKSYDQPRQHIKRRDVILPTKVHLIKARVFPVVMYGCESWITKKADGLSFVCEYVLNEYQMVSLFKKTVMLYVS